MPISYMHKLLKSIQKRVQSTVIILSQQNCLGVPLQKALKNCVQQEFSINGWEALGKTTSQNIKFL